MKMREAAELQRKWGGKPCNHPEMDREQEDYAGAHTGEYVCTTCGKLFMSRKEWEEQRQKSK
jgi:hypothetical protein